MSGRGGVDALLQRILHGDEEALEQLRELSQLQRARSHGMGNTALYYAACSGKVKLLRRCLEAEPSLVNVSNRNGDTPLMAAVVRCSIPGALLLLEHGARVRTSNRSKMTCLHLAAVKAWTELRAATGPGHNLIHRLRSNVHSLTVLTQQLLAALARQSDSLEAALADGDSRGRHPLHLAARGACPELVQALLAEGANPCAQDASQCTPVECAEAAIEVLSVLTGSSSGPATERALLNPAALIGSVASACDQLALSADSAGQPEPEEEGGEDGESGTVAAAAAAAAVPLVDRVSSALRVAERVRKTLQRNVLPAGERLAKRRDLVWLAQAVGPQLEAALTHACDRLDAALDHAKAASGSGAGGVEGAGTDEAAAAAQVVTASAELASTLRRRARELQELIPEARRSLQLLRDSAAAAERRANDRASELCDSTRGTAGNSRGDAQGHHHQQQQGQVGGEDEEGGKDRGRAQRDGGSSVSGDDRRDGAGDGGSDWSRPSTPQEGGQRGSQRRRRRRSRRGSRRSGHPSSSSSSTSVQGSPDAGPAERGGQGVPPLYPAAASPTQRGIAAMASPVVGAASAPAVHAGVAAAGRVSAATGVEASAALPPPAHSTTAAAAPTAPIHTFLLPHDLGGASSPLAHAPVGGGGHGIGAGTGLRRAGSPFVSRVAESPLGTATPVTTPPASGPSLPWTSEAAALGLAGLGSGLSSTAPSSEWDHSRSSEESGESSYSGDGASMAALQTQLESIVPVAAALDLRVAHLLGIGTDALSDEQLETLQALHARLAGEAARKRAHNKAERAFALELEQREIERAKDAAVAQGRHAP